MIELNLQCLSPTRGPGLGLKVPTLSSGLVFLATSPPSHSEASPHPQQESRHWRTKDAQESPGLLGALCQEPGTKTKYLFFIKPQQQSIELISLRTLGYDLLLVKPVLQRCY